MPYTWIVLALLIALITKRAKRRKIFLITSVCLIFFFGNSFIIDEFIRAWEVPAIKLEEDEKYEVAIVLGGMIVYDETLDRYNFNSSTDRLLQTLLVKEAKQVDKVIFSGGSGDINHQQYKEAHFVKDYLNRIDYGTRDFVFEPDSRNTHENADSSVAILKRLYPNTKLDGKVLLVTSAYHMRRSLACFEKAGIKCVPYSTNRLAGPRKYAFSHLVIPNSRSINYWNAYLHELLGYLIYWVVGYV